MALAINGILLDDPNFLPLSSGDRLRFFREAAELVAKYSPGYEIGEMTDCAEDINPKLFDPEADISEQPCLLVKAVNEKAGKRSILSMLQSVSETPSRIGLALGVGAADPRQCETVEERWGSLLATTAHALDYPVRLQIYAGGDSMAEYLFHSDPNHVPTLMRFNEANAPEMAITMMTGEGSEYMETMIGIAGHPKCPGHMLWLSESGNFVISDTDEMGHPLKIPMLHYLGAGVTGTGEDSANP